MERNRTRTLRTSAVMSAVATVVLSTACSAGMSDLTAAPIATPAETEYPRATVVVTDALEEHSPVMVALPPDANPAADPTDPVQVASALVTVLTNRRGDLPAEIWRQRWERWVTPEFATVLDARRPNGVYDEEVRVRDGQVIGIVVGWAKGRCSPEHCRVLLIVHQTLLIDGRPIDERNFVSWQVDLEASTDLSWRASDVTLGGAL